MYLELARTGRGLSFGERLATVRNNTTSTTFAVGDVVMLDLASEGDAALDSTATDRLEYASNGSIFSHVIVPSTGTDLANVGIFGVAKEEIAPYKWGTIMLQGVMDMPVNTTGSGFAYGDDLAVEASVRLTDNDDLVGGNRKVIGIALDNSSTTGDTTVRVIFDGVYGFR